MSTITRPLRRVGARARLLGRRSALLAAGAGLALVPALPATAAVAPVTRSAAAASASASYPYPQHVTGGVATHDPSMIRAKDGSWYVFSTGPGIQIRHSRDRTYWRYEGEVLPQGATWASTYQGGGAHDIWAPDVSYHHGTYYLYYAVSSFGSNNSAIGLATSKTLRPGSWTDHGLVYASTTTSDFNAIDPGLIVDPQGRWWLSLGSFWSGIKMIQLDPATGKPSTPDTTRYSLVDRHVPPNAVEGAYVVHHGGYYYLFASFDFCCQGLSSTYNIRVGRSTSVTGPYVDESGTPMLAGGGTTILATHGYVVGPGGQTVLRDGGRELLVYHYYDGLDGGTPHLGINPLRWVGGWPVVAPATG